MVYRFLYLFFSIFLLTACGPGAAQENRPFLLNMRELEQNRVGLAPGQGAGEPEREVRGILRRADRALEQGPWSVTDKEQTPPSGDKHDFLDHAGYWWPDPDQPDGKPYIRKDGEGNPGRVTDFPDMNRMAENVRLLGLAWYYTGEEKYAAHAAELLRVWFLNEDTKMNPNLNYTALIPGRNENLGRGSGLIRTRVFVDMLDGVQLLGGSESWAEQDHQALQDWFGEYTEWMQNSTVGKKGSQQPNNIGTAYDMQLVCFALFTGDEELAEAVLRESVPERMENQFEENGSQPYELRRTRSWNYSLANLRYWFKLAKLAEHVDIDLWAYESPSGKSLKKAYRFLQPVAHGQKTWDHEQIRNTNFQKSFKNLADMVPEHYKRSRD